ncbi:MAG: hypothetical protein GY718_09230 [Lentisphaerae bacterium]|nr:hypothetical protein [Lentisphaerota bacterium]
MTVEWLSDNGEKIENGINSPEEWKETSGTGKVLVYKKGTTKGKHKKLIFLSEKIKKKLDQNIVGSQVLGIEALIDYALEHLAEQKKNLEI